MASFSSIQADYSQILIKFELIKETELILYTQSKTILIHQATRMEITEKEYEAALKRIDELLPLVTDDTPDSDPNLIELLKVSNIVEEYEDVHYPIPDIQQSYD